MPNISDDIASATLKNSIDLIRYEEHLSDKVKRLLNKLQKELAAEIADRSLQRTQFSEARLAQLIKAVDAAIAQAYSDITIFHAAEMTELARIQAVSAASIVNASVGVVMVETAFNSHQLKALASNVLIEGAPSAEWWARQAKGTREKFADAIRMGVARGETVPELVSRVTSPGSGMMRFSYQNAAALVRSSVQTVNNSIRKSVYEDNEDIFDGSQWLSTLDMRTCETCMALDGATWDNDMKPKNGGMKYPGLIAHMGCRCVTIPILKPWEAVLQNKDMAKKLDAVAEQNPRTRASMDGGVSAKMHYGEWLKTQNVATQKEILGDGKYKLWKENKLTMRDLVAQNGRPLSLKEIEGRL